MAARSSVASTPDADWGSPATGRAKRSFHSGQYSFSRNALAAFQGRDFGQPQMLHQAILRRQKTAFHAAFGLRRVRQNRADSQLPQRASQLGQPICLASSALLSPGRGATVNIESRSV